MANQEPAVQPAEKKSVSVPDKIIIKDLAEKMNLPVTSVIAELMKNGIMSSMNEWIDFDTAAIVADDLGYTAQKSEEESTKEEEEQILKQAFEKDSENLVPRPPVVVVMGHVDHGKTTLLDAIRETNVVDKEAGGITQSIGAYQVTDNGKLITLIDTPGHEAFSKMRSRGAKIADIAILIVSADDGVKPQTKEALEIIRKEKMPFLVAINKVDKPEANVEKVKKELSELGLVPEEWGGKTITVTISAKKKQGIKELLEMVLLLSDLEKNSIMANPDREAIGTVIETYIDKSAGPKASVLIQTGTLKLGDNVVVGEVYGKVKRMKDWQGNLLQQAVPSQPVLILGLKSTPYEGDLLYVTEDPEEIKKIAKKQRLHVLQNKVAQTTNKTSYKDAKDEKEEKARVKKFKIILKSDTLGSQEAILGSLEKMKHPDVQAVIVSKGLGNITEKDILQADSSGAQILGFNTVLTPQAQEVQKDRNASINIFSIIYELIDLVKSNLEKLLPPEKIHLELGTVEILALFKKEKDSQVIGGKVTVGKAEADSLVRIVKKGELAGYGKILQLQAEKKNIKEVLKDAECGMKVKTETAIGVGDVLEFYREEEKPRQLGF